MSDFPDIMERGFDIFVKGILIALALCAIFGIIVLGIMVVVKFPLMILVTVFSFGLLYLLGRYAPKSWG